MYTQQLSMTQNILGSAFCMRKNDIARKFYFQKKICDANTVGSINFLHLSRIYKLSLNIFKQKHYFYN